MTDGQPKDRNDVSSSTASTSAEKRKEYNKRHYAKRKVLKVSTGDISQSDSPILKENVSCTLTEKGKEYNKDRMFQFTTTNGQPKDHYDHYGVSSSTAYTLAENRKEYNKRYYASHKVDNRALKFCSEDIFRIDTSIERMPRIPLQSSIPKAIVLRTSIEKRKERNRRYYVRCKANGKRVSNDSQVAQPLTDDNTAATTPSEGLVLSRGTKMINSKNATTELGDNVAEPTTVHKNPVLASKKVALRDVQNDNSNQKRIDTSIESMPRRPLQSSIPKTIVLRTSIEKRKERNRRYYVRCKANGKHVSNDSQVAQPPTNDNMPATTSEGLILSPVTKMINSKNATTELGNNVAGPTTVNKNPVLASKKVALRDVQNDNSNITRNADSQRLFADASKTCGTKRLTPDYASSPIMTNNGAHEHFNYPRRKYEFDGNREKNVGHPKAGSLTQIQQEAGQISGKNVHYGSLMAPKQIASKSYVSRVKESKDAHWAERFIRLQNFIKQCDGSDHNRENIKLLMRLSPLELSKHAVELEKRAIQLAIEEGKEMRRMQALNILGKPSITRNPFPIGNNTTQELNSKAANR